MMWRSNLGPRLESHMDKMFSIDDCIFLVLPSRDDASMSAIGFVDFPFELVPKEKAPTSHKTLYFGDLYFCDLWGPFL